MLQSMESQRVKNDLVTTTIYLFLDVLGVGCEQAFL